MANLSLFQTEPKFPSGFKYEPEFINPSEEQSLVSEIKKLELGHLTIRGQPSKRRIKQFGYKYSFETKKLTAGTAIPDWILPLQNKVADYLCLRPLDLSEVLITEYQPSSSINWHTDAAPFDQVVGISLLGQCLMKLRKINDHRQVVALTLDPQSLYLLSGQVRSLWQHHIPAAKELRYSITFRTLRH